jgi:hypothetical protein
MPKEMRAMSQPSPAVGYPESQGGHECQERGSHPVSFEKVCPDEKCEHWQQDHTCQYRIIDIYKKLKITSLDYDITGDHLENNI